MIRDALYLLGSLPSSTARKIDPAKLQYLAGALNAHYNQTFRAYHNLNHINRMLRSLTYNQHTTPGHPDELAIAILFHDTVYNLRAPSPENELASADVAIVIGMHVFQDIDWSYVHKLIMATQHDGKLLGATYDERLIADLDLQTLSLPYEEYAIYSENIRKEHLTIYTLDEFNAGRYRFLKTMLDRPQIFYVSAGETQARDNLKRDLESLY